jgi:serine/threonine-protein kinase
LRLIGETINGYKFISFLGEGSFGSVYKVKKDKKFYAVKLFRESYILEEFRRGKNNRINREIEIMQKAKHPLLVEYIEHFSDELLNVPQIFLVMEYIEGETLSEKISNNIIINSEDIFRKILEAVNFLHSVGVIHRDLKPENIIILNDGSLKILDYGLSKLIDYTSITKTGNILGTFLYMSPEQITDSKHIDYRSDLYTTGMIFYQILTGELPFRAQLLPELIDKIKNEMPIPPRKWNHKITNKHENVILKLLEKDPYKRYSNVEEVLSDLDEKLSLPVIDIDHSQRFILRTYDEKSVLEQFMKDHPDKKLYFKYPANHQFRQKGLLKIVQGDKHVTMIDPATIRLAYNTYTDVKGLTSLEYCPFLELMHKEVSDILSSSGSERLIQFLKRIDEAIQYYGNLKMVFKSRDYSHLIHWKNVFNKIGEKYV